MLPLDQRGVGSGTAGEGASNLSFSEFFKKLKLSRWRARSLENERELFHALIDNSSDFIGIADAEGNPVYVNPAGRRMVGMPDDVDVSATKISQYYPAVVRDFAENVIVKSMVEKGHWSGETFFRHWVSGRPIPVSDTHFMIRSPKTKRIIGMGTISRDISQKRALENATAVNTAKNEFIANISHEIRTPIGVILGYADALIEDKWSDDERLRFAKAIKKNGEHLLELINGILDLAKVESGSIDIKTVEIDTIDFFQDIASQFRREAEGKGLYLQLSLAKNLPARLVVDDTKLKQILVNLIYNAIKFTDTGGIKVEVLMAAGPGPDSVPMVVRVNDSGCGVPEEKFEMIFERFTQVESHTGRKYGGTGIGLHLSRSLARAMGGDIRLVSSIQGRGSVFELTFIADIPGAKPTGVEWTEKGPEVISGQRLQLPAGHLNILLAEDHPDNRIIFQNLMSECDIDIAFAEDGRQAVDKALSGDHDLVLMDIQMPLLDGIGATNALRKAGYRKPIIAITAHAMQNELEQYLKEGFDGYLTKPYSREQLFAVLKTIPLVAGRK